MYWAMHRRLFAQVRFANTRVVWLNLLFLLTAGFPLIVYAAAMVVAASSPFWARFLFLSVPGLYLLLVAGLRVDRRTRVAAEDLS